MEQTKSQSIQKNSKPLPIPKNLNDYTNCYIPGRCWEISYGYKRKFYLTNEERKYLLKKLSEGFSIVQVGALTLTARLEYIIPFGVENEEDKKPKPKYEYVFGQDKQGRYIAWPKKVK